jgi:ABC-type lipoprotein export system ATPase subunit
MTSNGHPLVVQGLTYAIAGRTLFMEAELTAAQGESVAVMGPSGCGKSTLLSMVLGLVRPERGRVQVMGEDVARLRGDRLAALRADNLGMVFQFGELIPELTPLENVLLASQLAGKTGPQPRERARELLEEFGVPRDAATADLSGGERQRVAVARALMNRPMLILADEPTGALDQTSRDQVAEHLFALPAKHQCALVLVTHDPVVARRADRLLRIENGAFVQDGTGS